MRSANVFHGLMIAFGWASTLSAATLFSDPAQSLANFDLISDSDTTATVFDYSGLNISEAPGTLAGSTATTGIQLKANKGDTTAAVTGINLLLGATPQSFTGTHTLQFYVWMNVPSGATNPSEGMSAGVARNSVSGAIYSAVRDTRGNGAWFSMGNDNGQATDFRQMNGLSNDVSLGDEQMTTQESAAFSNKLGTTNPAPANQWVKVDMVMDTSSSPVKASVYFNNVLFSTDTSTNSSGFAWIGYEDPIANIGKPGSLSAIIDNVTVFSGTVPEPRVLDAILSSTGVLWMRRRRHPTFHKA